MKIEYHISAIRCALDSLQHASDYAEAIQLHGVVDPEGLRARNVALLDTLDKAGPQIKEANTALDQLITHLFR